MARCIAVLSLLLLMSSPARALLGATRTELRGKYGVPKALAGDFYDEEFSFSGWRLKVRYAGKTQLVIWLSLFLPRKEFDVQTRQPQEGKLAELAGRFQREQPRHQQDMRTMRYFAYPSFARWIYLRPQEVEVELILDETVFSLMK